MHILGARLSTSRTGEEVSSQSSATGTGRPPKPANDSFVDADREGPGLVVGQLRSASTGWYGSEADFNRM